MSAPDDRPPVVDPAGERPPVVEPRGTWANARDVFLAPARTFRDARARPAVAAPMILLIAASAVGLAIAMLGFAPAAEAMDRVLEASGVPGGGWSRVAVTATGVFAVALTVPVVALIVAGLLWAWSTLQDAESRFTVALAAVLWSRLVVPVETVVDAAVASAAGRALQGASIGPALLVDPTAVPAPLYAALAKLDVFSIWIVVLTTLAGVHALGLGRGKAAAFAVALWAVGVALAMASAAVGGAATPPPAAPSM